MTQTQQQLEQILNRIDGKGYPAYKDIRGGYSFEGFTLFIDHVQGDPFAGPSRARVRVPMQVAKFPPSTYHTRSREIALRDYLARGFAKACKQVSDQGRGSGKSGLIMMPRPGQEILERSSIIVTQQYVEARFVIGLPAQGRRVRGRQAMYMLCQDIPKIVKNSLNYRNLAKTKLSHHLDIAEDADTLRGKLAGLGLVAFIADGAILPRRSGVNDHPLQSESVIPFRSPDSLRVTVTLPHQGEITGMGLPKGVSLIVGGGYHGKSTILAALERGIYNHIPEDGRERVITDPTAVKIRAEDGRRVEGVDIRPFINNLPNNISAATFRTENASGSTSQAANIIEALEVGAKLILLDEDTCATNFMIRDARMQALVEKSGEPITPFIDRVRELTNIYGISSIIVLGGSGDYFDVADTIIRLDNYVLHDVTKEAKLIATQQVTGRQVEATEKWPNPAPRIPVGHSIDPRKGKRDVNIKSRALRAVLFGTEEIDVSLIAQLVDEGQVRAIGQALNLARTQFMQRPQPLPIIIDEVTRTIEEQGLDALDQRLIGDFVAFRPYELAATLNRLRTLKVKSL